MPSSRSQMATPGSKRPGNADRDVKTEKRSRRQTPRWPWLRNNRSTRSAPSATSETVSLPSPTITRNVARRSTTQRRGEMSSRPLSPRSTLRSSSPVLSGPAPSRRIRRLIWSGCSARRQAHPPGRPCGATTPCESKRSSTATAEPARPRGGGAKRPTGRAKRSLSPTGYSKPAIVQPTQSHGPTLPAKLPPPAKRRTGTSRTRERSTPGCHHSRRRGGVPRSITLPNDGVPSSACSREPLLRTRTGRGPSASTGNHSTDQIWLLSTRENEQLHVPVISNVPHTRRVGTVEPVCRR